MLTKVHLSQTQTWPTSKSHDEWVVVTIDDVLSDVRIQEADGESRESGSFSAYGRGVDPPYRSLVGGVDRKRFFV